MQKAVIVSGASGNLGKVVVERFLREGFHVIAPVAPGKSLGYSAAGSLETVTTNISDEVSVDALMNHLAGRQLQATLLLAGGYHGGDLSNTHWSDIQSMVETNVQTAFPLAKASLQRMQQQAGGGRIVLIGARPALQPADGRQAVAYALSKSMLFTLANLLNAEGASHNVVTHVVVPSTLDTPGNRQAMPAADFTRWVKPESVAELLVTLSAERGSPLRDGVFKMYGDS